MFEKLPFVASNQVGGSFEKVLVFVEVIPREGMNEVREAIYNASEGVHTVNDALGYECLNDAIIDAQGIGSRVLDYVEAENLFFAFGESVEALRESLRHFPLPHEVLQPFPGETGEPNEEKGCGEKKKNPKNKAIVLCKLRKAKALLNAFPAKEEDAARHGDCRQVNWGELQELQNKLEHAGDVRERLENGKLEGRAA